MNMISIRKGKESVERKRGYKPRYSFMVWCLSQAP